MSTQVETPVEARRAFSSCSSVAFSSNGKLFVSGANFTTGDAGYIAEVDVDTGQIVRKFDPADGDPNDGDFTFYQLAFTRQRCTLGALDLSTALAAASRWATRLFFLMNCSTRS